jgi:hypothetical protein
MRSMVMLNDTQVRIDQQMTHGTLLTVGLLV